MEVSDFKVPVTKITEIFAHPNADRLSLCKVDGLGYQIIIPKDKFQIGDKVVYIPVDSVLPPELELRLFPAESKIKLTNSRIRAIKIRSIISQGMLESVQMLFPEWDDSDLTVGECVAKTLSITKYEPPVPAFQSAMGQSGQASKKKTNPNFHVYTKFPRIENYPTMFDSEDKVIVTEKIHGTNFRAGWVPYVATTWPKRILSWLGLAPKWQFVYGSHYTQLSDKLLYKGFYEKSVYAEMVKKYDLDNSIRYGDIVYGEVYGSGIQKGYNYNLKDSRDLILFDIKRDGKYLNWDIFRDTTWELGLTVCPILFTGKFKDCDLDQLKQGSSVLAPEQKVREGVVIRTIEEPEAEGRKVAKVINPEYLMDKNNTDFH